MIDPGGSGVGVQEERAVRHRPAVQPPRELAQHARRPEAHLAVCPAPGGHRRLVQVQVDAAYVQPVFKTSRVQDFRYRRAVGAPRPWRRSPRGRSPSPASAASVRSKPIARRRSSRSAGDDPGPTIHRHGRPSGNHARCSAANSATSSAATSARSTLFRKPECSPVRIAEDSGVVGDSAVESVRQRAPERLPVRHDRARERRARSSSPPSDRSVGHRWVSATLRAYERATWR